MDLTRPEWQRVEIPLNKLGISWPPEQIQRNGAVEGTFYIDGMRLLTMEGIPAMASGLYLHRLDNGGQVKVRRLLLLR